MSERMRCRLGHSGLKVEMINEEENWIAVSCITCCDVVWYNGA